MSGSSGRIRHIVLMQFKESVPEERVDELLSGFRSLAEEVAAVAGVEMGANTSLQGYDQGYTHGVLMTFECREDLERYLKDETHLDFVEVLMPELERCLVFDFEV